MEKSCIKLKRILLSIAGMALVFFISLHLSGGEAFALTGYDPQTEEF